MEYISFRVLQASSVPRLGKSLHLLFSSNIHDSGVNDCGVFVDTNERGLLKEITVFKPYDIQSVLKNNAIMKLVLNKAIDFDLNRLDTQNTSKEINCVSLKRDRKTEKGSPIFAMKRFERSERSGEDMMRFKSKVKGFIDSESAYLPISSSQGNKFTLRFTSVFKTLNIEDVLNQRFSFNSYGLSAGSNQVFLPALRG
jgi:hypothetical protein